MYNDKFISRGWSAYYVLTNKIVERSKGQQQEATLNGCYATLASRDMTRIDSLHPLSGSDQLVESLKVGAR